MADTIQKWGFGMAPISERMQTRYSGAVSAISDFLRDNVVTEQLDLEKISELKGMFNRCLKKDQWDWFSVLDRFGFPNRVDMLRIVFLLSELRQGIAAKDLETTASIKMKLIDIKLLRHLQNYQDGLQQSCMDQKEGWIYILSTREQPNILKIGMTHRSVMQRVKEINAATGVLFPISARTVYRVKDASQAEKSIFHLLQPYRLRLDREFFRMDFQQAARSIEDYLTHENLLVSKDY